MEKDLSNLRKVFGKVSKADAHYVVHRSAKIYPDTIKLFEPTNPFIKKIPFMEDEDEDSEDWSSRVKANSKTSNESNLERSLRQTQTTIKDLVLCNSFDVLATFTFSKKKVNRQDPVAVKRVMATWLDNQRKKIGKFNYLIIAEYHKDGKSIHFHALIGNYKGKLVLTDKKSKGRPVYNFPDFRAGHNSAIKIDDLGKVSSYVRKYITKDMPQLPGQHRFWANTGLKRPILVDNPDESLMRGEPLWTIDTEYGRTSIFPNLEGSDES